MTVRTPLVRALMVLLLVAGLAVRLQEIGPALQHIGERDNPRPELRDFRDTIYEPGRDLRAGDDPYDPLPYQRRHPGHQELDLYAPHLFVVDVPMSFLPIAVAQLLWLAVLLLAVGALAWLAWALAGRPPDVWVVAGTSGLLLCTNPVQQVVQTGNITIVLAAAAAGALYWSRARPVLAGVLLAVVCIKPQLGLPLAAVLAIGLWRWRAVIIGAATAAAAAIVPTVALVVAAGGVGDLADALNRNLDYSTNLYADISGRSDLMRSDVWGAIGKIAKQNPTTGTQLLTFVVATSIAVVLLRRQRAAVRLTGAAVALIMTTMLVGLPHFAYDLTLLAVAVVAIVVASERRDWLVILLALACLVPLLHVGTTDTVLDKLGVSVALRQSIDAAAVTAAFVLAALATWRRDQDPADAPATASRWASR